MVDKDTRVDLSSLVTSIESKTPNGIRAKSLKPCSEKWEMVGFSHCIRSKNPKWCELLIIFFTISMVSRHHPIHSFLFWVFWCFCKFLSLVCGPCDGDEDDRQGRWIFSPFSSECVQVCGRQECLHRSIYNDLFINLDNSISTSSPMATKSSTRLVRVQAIRDVNGGHLSCQRGRQRHRISIRTTLAW